MMAEERKINTDGTISCGVFIPIPFWLARQFPDKKKFDDSVPHFTVLYAGNLSPKDYRRFVGLVAKVARNLRPFQLDLSHYGEFTNSDGLKIAHMTPGFAASSRLAILHGMLRRAADDAGVDLEHNYGHESRSNVPYEVKFRPHATLAYLNPNLAYTGPKPTGSWKVTEIECWGHEKIRLPLGKLRHDQPIKSMAEALTARQRNFADSVVRAIKRQPENEKIWNYIQQIIMRARKKSGRFDLIRGGLADRSKLSDFDPRQLAIGMRIEREHTKDPVMAREIAMDHLRELPDYYDRLKRIEGKNHKVSEATTSLSPEETHPGPAGSSGGLGLASDPRFVDWMKKVRAGKTKRPLQL